MSIPGVCRRGTCCRPSSRAGGGGGAGTPTQFVDVGRGVSVDLVAHAVGAAHGKLFIRCLEGKTGENKNIENEHHVF